MIARTLASLSLLALGCSNNNTPTCNNGGGAIVGAMDTHCQTDGGLTMQPTDPSVCNFIPDMAGTDMGPAIADYGDTLYNATGYDDDCKYKVNFTVPPICQNQNVSFTVTASKTVDGSPLTGSNPFAQVYLSDTHDAPNTNQVATETSPGNYTVGPVQFDASGMWTVRFHFYENCTDYSDQSQHGHIAFYLKVP